MLKSLRARLMLVSAGLSGAALAVFAAWTYARLYDAGLQEIDVQLRNLGERALLRPQRAEEWQELDRSLALLSRSDTGRTHLMLVLGRGGETIAQSAYWPEGLPRDQYEAPRPELFAPGGRPRPGDFADGPPRVDPFRDNDRPPPRGGPEWQPGPGSFDRPEDRSPPGELRQDGAPPRQGDRPEDRGPPGEFRREGLPPRQGDRPEDRGPQGEFRREGTPPRPGDRPEDRGPPGEFRPEGTPPRPGDRPEDRGPQGEFRREGTPPRPGDRPEDRGPQGDFRREGTPPRQGDRPEDRGPVPYPPPLRTPVFSSRDLQEGAWRIAELGAPHATLVIGLRLDNFRREMATVRTTFLSASGLALLGIVFGAWAVSNQALAPVRRLSRAIEGVSARGLNQRVPEETRDPELRQLTQQFNAMMARLEGSFTQAVRFSADAAHELKTPLSILQGHLEEALRKEPAGSDRQETYSKLLEEVQRLKTIVGKLLLLARADAGQLTPSTAPVNLSQAIEETCEDTRILAPSLDISAEIEPNVRIDADEALLRQVLQNLCSNAIKYNVKAGKIRFRLRRKSDSAVFTVWNMGKVIPQSDQERIFDRFYRVDTSRARKVGGAGLGLSLAREIARAHGGDLTLEPPKEGWIGFRLTLPLGRWTFVTEGA
jgi:heavy metal sensor kinase